MAQIKAFITAYSEVRSAVLGRGLSNLSWATI
jgi:hypothetical protein